MDVDNSFDEMFDRNRDGILDLSEQSERWDFMEDTGELGGYSRDDLLLMDEDERREILESEGLDPDGF
ncbi:MAG: hypothetical protein K5871_06455 [Lachnospiraceae bacterium]|nr:hypothetical protein [Lachnospiraceae bacterium]